MKAMRGGVVRSTIGVTARRANVRTEPAPRVEPRLGALSIARIASVERAASGPPTVMLRVGRQRVAADLDPAIDVEVLETAARCGDAVLVVADGDAVTVVGALRTRATPGVDIMDHVAIRARTVDVESETFSVRAKTVAVAADTEISLRAKAAFVALRAAGEIESFAERIVTRAEGVHKLIGRMLRLN